MWELTFAFCTVRICIVWEWIMGSVVGSAGKPSLFGELGDYCAVKSPPESPLGHPAYVTPPGHPPRSPHLGHLLGQPKIIVHHPPQLRLPGIIRDCRCNTMQLSAVTLACLCSAVRSAAEPFWTWLELGGG